MILLGVRVTSDELDLDLDRACMPELFVVESYGRGAVTRYIRWRNWSACSGFVVMTRILQSGGCSILWPGSALDNYEQQTTTERCGLAEAEEEE